MEDNFLVAFAGALLSLLFSYVPGLSDWYKSIDDTYKRLLMLGLVVLSAGIAYVASCYLDYSFITCDEVGLKKLLELVIWAAIGNQVTYNYSPRKVVK